MGNRAARQGALRTTLCDRGQRRVVRAATVSDVGSGVVSRTQWLDEHRAVHSSQVSGAQFLEFVQQEVHAREAMRQCTKGANQMNDWSRQIGEKHRRREQSASHVAQAVVDSEHERRTACRLRWPMILMAIRGMTDEYNAGFGLDAVVVIDGSDPEHPSITLESLVSEHPVLGIMVDGAELCVRTGSAVDSTERTHWVALNRSDDDTAAYLVQDWMQRL